MNVSFVDQDGIVYHLVHDIELQVVGLVLDGLTKALFSIMEIAVYLILETKGHIFLRF